MALLALIYFTRLLVIVSIGLCWAVNIVLADAFFNFIHTDWGCALRNQFERWQHLDGLTRRYGVQWFRPYQPGGNVGSGIGTGSWATYAQARQYQLREEAKDPQLTRGRISSWRTNT